MDYKAEFRYRAHRLRTITARNDEEAQITCDQHSSMGARLVKSGIDAKWLNLEMPARQWWPTPTPMDDADALWLKSWRIICQAVVNDSSDWRQRARNHADICERLSNCGLGKHY